MDLCNIKGYILRSGGAEGADSFFEEFSLPEQREIYLPWRNFNNNNSDLYTPMDAAYKIAEKYHPGWLRLSFGAKKLMARNVHQVLGQDLKTPCQFIICWTKDGKASGGTGQAIRIATSMDIPVYNLKNTGDIEELAEFLLDK
jgi:hypothetical protein